VLLLLAVACGTKTRKHENAQAATKLRASVAAIEAYRLDHNGTYAGMTLARLRDIDSGIATISVVSASKKTYCAEATAGDARAFKNGPASAIMLGSCSDPKSGKPYKSPPPVESSSSSKPLDSINALRASIPAIEAYLQDHNGYTGMTASKLRKEIDQGFPPIKIVSAEKNTYCIEITVDGVSSFARGPMGSIRSGHCSS
jgi:hypothetical protein